MNFFGHGINRYFFKILFSFVLIILMPVGILGMVWYQMTGRQEKEYRTEHEIERMHSVLDEIERRIGAVESDVAVFIYGNEFRGYGSRVSSWEIGNALHNGVSALIQKNSVLASIYIYDTEQNKIYNSASRTYPVEEFYDTEWMALVEDRVHMQRLPWRISLDREVREQITGTSLNNIYGEKKYLSIVSQKLFGMYVLANIDIRLLGESVQAIYTLADGQEAGIMTKDGYILYNSRYGRVNQMMEIELSQAEENRGIYHWQDSDRIYFCGRMNSAGLYYIESYPVVEFYQAANSYGIYILGICTALAVVLILLANLLSQRLYRPIGRLYVGIEKAHTIASHNMKDELDVLFQVFNEMNQHYLSSVQEEKSHKEFMRMAKLRMLVCGNYSQDNFFVENNEVFQSEQNKRYQLLVCDISGYEQVGEDSYERFSFRLKSVINSYLQFVSKGMFTEMSDTIFTALYTVDLQEEGYIRNLLIQAVNQLTGQDNCFAVSPLFNKTESVRGFYEICCNTIENAAFFDLLKSNILLAKEPEEASFDYQNLVNYEAGFIRAVIGLDQEAVSRLLDDLSAELCKTQNREYAANVCLRILVTLDKEFGFSRGNGLDLIKTIQDKKTLSQIIDAMRDVLLTFMNRLHDDDMSGSSYCQEAKRYIEENYMRDMNVTEIADYLGISYAYLSKIFRSQAEGNGKLSEYLNVFRIEKSKEYLCQTNLALGEIAERVGYNNVQSFQRFFKKYENLTPGEYRKLKSRF